MTNVDKRLCRLSQQLQDQQLDLYLATHTADIRWLTGFHHIFDSEQAHAMLVSCERLSPSGALRLLHSDGRYSGAMRRQSNGVLDCLDDDNKSTGEFLAEQLKRLVPTKYANWPLRIGIEADLPLRVWRSLIAKLDELGLPGYELVELDDLIFSLRALKDVEEVEVMRQAQGITDAALLHMLDYLRPGLTELEAQVELDFFMRQQGSEGLSFQSILAAGPNSAIPHHVSGDRRLASGDFVLMDFGARLDDYCSDMTRTVVLGQADERQRQLYATVLAAQTQAIAMLRPGIPAAEPCRRVNEIFAEQGGGQLIHGLGHGVGLDIHELPVLNMAAKGCLVEGHVFTVEPGIYESGFGGVRIEDYGVMGASGFDNFTASPKELIEL
ncbi:MAG: aminopeptidase P family protein [Actinomycetia bacterium]|nr:aminopeptidase P family protein [Actinomycetes bacterium]